MTVLRNILAALCLAAFGVYVLRSYPGTPGLIGGALSVLGALCIAFPTQMGDASKGLKNLLVIFIPIVKGALPGGQRADDPPAPPKGDAP
jgi:hypothetical protein